MKIGTVTFHCAYNFGSALQTYALKKYLTNLGHEVHVVDYRSRDFDSYKLFRKSGLKSYVADLLFFYGNLRRRNSFQSFWRNYFDMTEHTYAGDGAEREMTEDLKGYNAFICGSDQIWNLDCTLGPVPPFFLSFVSDEVRKIAYAPSLSHAKFEDRNFTADDQKNIGAWLDRFDAISVREISVADQFQRLTDKNIVETLDPTLLLDLEDYKHIQSSELPKGLEAGKYIFAYTLWPNFDMIRYLDGLAADRGLPIVYYSKKPIRYKSHSINVWGIGPADFLALIDKSDCVVSNSFHATVFSILYGKPFLTFGTEKSSSRMKTLIAKLGLPEDHLLPAHFDGAGDVKPFASELDMAKLRKLRAGSERFLENALK